MADLVQLLLAGGAGEVQPVALLEPYDRAIRQSEYSGDPNNPRFNRPFWDERQWTSGYGTRASGPGDVQSREVLERRFSEELGRSEARVRAFVPQGTDEGTIAALTSLTHNAGEAWMRGGLGQAIRAGDLATARNIFTQYTNAPSNDPRVEAGLANRRNREVAWFGQGGTTPMADDSSMFAPPTERALATGPAVSASPPMRGPDVRDAPEQAGWSGWLKNPVNQAFALQMGINLMMPSWGGPGAALASAIGGGAEAAHATSRQIQDNDLARAQLASREREGELNRETQLRSTEMAVAGRQSVAEIRSQAMLERTRMNLLKTTAQRNQHAEEARHAFNILMRERTLDPELRSMSVPQLRALSLQIADERMGLFTGGVPTRAPGSPAPSRPGARAAPGGTTPAPAPAPAPAPSSDSIPPASPEIRTSPGGTSVRDRLEQMRRGELRPGGAAPASPGQGRSFEEFLSSGEARFLNNPGFVERLKLARPEWKQAIEQWQSMQQGATVPGGVP